MCLLIVLAGSDPEYPILVAGNRDESRTRKAAPPGLFVGERRRMLSPRDRRAGGTWLAVNDAGLFAGITNLAGTAPPLADAPSRGHLPHLALDQADLDAAARAVERELAARAYAGFQLVLSDGRRLRVLAHEPDGLRAGDVEGGVLVVSNEHRPGELEIPDLERVTRPGLPARQRLDALRPILLDEGGDGRHRILKKGGPYGTVSSSLIGVHRDDPRRLIWWYAPGPPDETRYRDYGNLGRRLTA